MNSHKRRLRNYLIHRRFQLKFTLIFLLIGVAIYVGIGSLYLKVMKENTELANVEIPSAGTSIDPEVEAAAKIGDDTAAQGLEAKDRNTTVILLGSLCVLVTIMILLGIYLTHKVAGPAHALHGMIDAISDGNWAKIRMIREGDELQELSRAVQRLADSLRLRSTEWCGELEEARRFLEGGKADRAYEMICELNQRIVAYVERA